MILTGAIECIDKGVTKAQELGFLVAIAVVDEAGHLVACHRMDGALWVTPDIARAKANAAAAFRATRTTSRPVSARVSSSRATWRRSATTSSSSARAASPFRDGQSRRRRRLRAVPAENDHVIAVAAAGNPVIPASH